MSVNHRDAAAVIELLDTASILMRHTEWRRGSVDEVAARNGTLLATGDLHDDTEHLEIILRLAHLDDCVDNHLILHELIHGDRLVNGVDFSYRMLCRAAEAIVRWPGQVHVLLANHELAQAFEYPVSKGFGDQVALFDEGLEWVFSDDAERVAEAVKRFIMAMPLALRTASGIMCAHSLPSPSAKFDAGAFARELTPADYAANTGAAWQMTWGRGLTAEHASRLATEWGVKLFVVGHSHVESGIEARGDRLLVINSDHERAVALPIAMNEEPPPASQLVNEAIPLGAYRQLRG